jgi:hypothetical protein
MPSQTFRPAAPLGLGNALRRLADDSVRFSVALLDALRRPTRDHHRLSLVEEANAVRAMAAAHRKTNPGFAADLMAAADRHEAAGTQA